MNTASCYSRPAAGRAAAIVSARNLREDRRARGTSVTGKSHYVITSCGRDHARCNCAWRGPDRACVRPPTDLRDLTIGTAVQDLPADGYGIFACMVDGVASDAPFRDWAGYRDCPADASGARQIRL